LIQNLVCALKGCPKDIQGRMVSHFTQADAEYGRRVAEGIGFAHSGDAGGNGAAAHNAAKASSTTKM